MFQKAYLHKNMFVKFNGMFSCRYKINTDNEHWFLRVATYIGRFIVYIRDLYNYVK